MADVIPKHPGVPEETYHALGRKTLFIFFFERANAAGAFLLAGIVLFVIQGQPFLTKTPIGDVTPYAALATVGCFILFGIIFLVSFFISWLIYTHYRFFLGENSLKIKRGILNKEEIAIPYRQIQDVDITRDLSFQAMGLSRIVILTAGEEKGDDQNEGVLPALDKDLAEWLQGELLSRANVQKVTTETPSQPGAGAGSGAGSGSGSGTAAA